MSKKSRIAIILDRSGSMGSIRSEAISAFNKQIETIKNNAAEIDTKVSLFTFSDKADAPIVWNQSVETLTKLTEETYVPDGMTSMYDSVGMAVNLLNGLPEADDKNTSFLTIIISDGAENNSKQFDSAKIATMVKRLQNTDRWTFTYLGANQDLTKVQQTLGIHAGNTMSFSANNEGMKLGSIATTQGLTGYFASVTNGGGAVRSFYSGTTVDADQPVVTKTKTV